MLLLLLYSKFCEEFWTLSNLGNFGHHLLKVTAKDKKVKCSTNKWLEGENIARRQE
jgi:hypothetical protein